MPSTAPGDRRLLDAALRCIARWGVAKTTLEDVAREAGCSRATIYRAFPGGKDALFAAVAAAEVDHFFSTVEAAVSSAADLESALVAGATTAARLLGEHDALQYLIAHEPDVVLPRIAFDACNGVLATVVDRASPWLAPHVGDDHARRAVEWVARIVLSYTQTPSDWVDLSDAGSARRLIATFVLPALVPVLETVPAAAGRATTP